MSARSAFTLASTSSRDVLDVDGVDPVTPVGQRLQRVAAGDEQVPAVEQQRHVGLLQQAVDLLDALDVGRRVVVEDRLEAAFARGVGGARTPSTSTRQRDSFNRSEASSAPRPGFAIRSGPPASHRTGRALVASPNRSSVACSPSIPASGR